MKNKWLLLYSWFVWIVTFFIPDIFFTMRFRGFLYSLGMKKAGVNFQVSSGARLYGLSSISVGDNVFIATNVVVNAGADILLEDEVMIGISAVLVSGNHTIKNGSYRFGEPERKSITIGFGSWIGGGAVITAGSSIPCSSIIAANSVTHNEITTSGLYSGVPAKKIK